MAALTFFFCHQPLLFFDYYKRSPFSGFAFCPGLDFEVTIKCRARSGNPQLVGAILSMKRSFMCDCLKSRPRGLLPHYGEFSNHVQIEFVWV